MHSQGPRQVSPLGLCCGSPQRPAPSCGSRQLCRAGRALDPAPGPQCRPLALRIQRLCQSGRQRRACPSSGKRCEPPLLPVHAYLLPASLTSQPAEPDLENVSLFNEEQAWPVSGHSSGSSAQPRGRQAALPAQLLLARAGAKPAFKVRKGRDERQPTGQTQSTQHGLHLAVRHLSPHRRWLQIPAGVRQGQDEESGCPSSPGLEAGAGFGATGFPCARQQKVSGWPVEEGSLLESQLLHQQVNTRVHFKPVQVVRVAL